MRKLIFYFLLILLLVAVGIRIGKYIKHSFVRIETLQDALLSYHAILQKEKTTSAIQEALQSEFNLSMPEASCYAPMFYNFSRLHCVDWTWGASVAWVESRFNPTLSSKAHALGLMQLMEELAQAYCDTLAISYEKGVTRWRDPLNLYIGLRFLGNSIRKYGIDSGLVVYHIGEPDMLAGKKAISGQLFIDLVRGKQQNLAYVYEGVLSMRKIND